MTAADRADPNIPPSCASLRAPATAAADSPPGHQNDTESTSVASNSDPVSSHDPNEVALVLSADPTKDQAYFLCQLSQQQLRRCLFPIGHLPKTEVRALAKQFNLSTSARKDSQGICFLGKLKFGDFLEHYLGVNPGPLVDRATGEVVGKHRGLWFHTIGQKAGLGFSLFQEVQGLGPWVVCEKDVLSNTIFVSNDPARWAQQKRTHVISNIKWINGVPTALRRHFNAWLPPGPQNKYVMKMKARHSPKFVYARITKCANKIGQPPTATATATAATTTKALTSCPPSELALLKDSETSGFNEMEVVLLGEETPFVSPGQFVAFFEGNVCLGSGSLS